MKNQYKKFKLVEGSDGGERRNKRRAAKALRQARGVKSNER